MSCSRLVGSIVLSFFLVTSLVANNIVTKNAKLGQNTEQSAEEGSFSNTGEDALLGTGTYMEGYNTAEEYQKVKNTDDVIKAGDPNHPKSVGPFKKGSLNENPLTFTNGAKNTSDVIKAKNESDVIKSSTRSNTDNSIESGAIGTLVKEGEVLRKEGSIVRSNGSDATLNINDNSHSAFQINTRSESIIKGQGTKVKSVEVPINLDYNKHSAFKMNTRPESIIKYEGTRLDCPAGTVDDCSGDGDCCPESWIGDGFEDCEDQAFGCDLTCYDNDGGDCNAGGTTTTTGGGANLIWTAPITFDWFCTGAPGSGTINFYDDGTADVDGYPGYWYQNNQTFDMPAGLCAAQELTPTVIFNFNDFPTSFAWETSGNGFPSDPGCGIHDDYGYNGPNVDGTTSINMADPMMCYGDTSTTTTSGGGCPAGTVEDCSGDGDCCAESWIGDGFEDCEDQAFGCDLTCYDNDGGDCGAGTTTTTTTTGGGCPAGTVDDCSGDGDCCPESWIGDGFEDCEDQAFGCDLTCYDNDGGDCDAGGGTTTTTTGGDCVVVASYAMTFDWYCTGSYGSSVVDFCEDGTALLAGAYTGTWGYTEAMTMGDGLCPGGDLAEGFFFEFDNYATRYNWSFDACGYHDDMGYNGEGNADGVTMLIDYITDTSVCYPADTTTTTTTTSGGGECPAGTVEDCSGDGDCCPESWIGDGFEDCEDQAFGCDLTCYDNDGGDCGGNATTTTTTTTTGGGCPAGTVDDCSGDGDCCPESWIGDGFLDCEDQQFGCDLTCYDNDGGDCEGCPEGEATCHDLSCAPTFEDCFAALGDPQYEEVITYDWGCTGDAGTTILTVWDDPDSQNDIGFVAGDNLWVSVWNDWSGSEVNIPAGDYCPEWTANTDWGFFFNDFPWVNYSYECEDESNSVCDGRHSFDGFYTVGGYSTSERINPDVCPDGFVDDCSGDGDCCPESWIGDGFEDCEDQAFGCDLTCYDNDGGDCGGNGNYNNYNNNRWWMSSWYCRRLFR